MTVHDAALRPVAWGAWSRLAVASIARLIVVSIVGGLVWAVLPMAIGWRPTTVMSDSMAPRFLTGDVAVSLPSSPQLETIGSILLVDDPDHPGRLRLHRMVDVAPDGWIVTKGDANARPDSSHIDPAHVRGVAIARIPFLGLPLAWAKGHQWWLIGVAFAGFVVLVGLSTIDADLRAAPEGEAPPTRRARRRRRRRDRTIPPALLVGSASVLALVLALTTGAHAAFGKAQANPTSGWTATSDFACWPTTAAADSAYFYYRFDRWPAATATDFSTTANPRPGTVGTGTSKNAGACPNSSGAASPSLKLDGTANGVVTPAASGAVASSNTAYSLEAWFLTTGTSGKILGWGSSQTGASATVDRHLYMGTDGKVYFGAQTSGNANKTIASTVALNNGAWHHVVATFSTSVGMVLYVDGAQVATNTDKTVRSFTGYWRVGYDSVSGWTNAGTATPGFNGSLDNVAVYATAALTAAQVSSHYSTGH